MWQRKPAHKVSEIDRKYRGWPRRLTEAAVVGFSIGVFVFLVVQVIPNRYAFRPLHVDEAALWGLISSVLVVLLYLWFERSSLDDRTRICDTCHEVVRFDGRSTCSCGGAYEPLDHWEWKPDADSKQESAES